MMVLITNRIKTWVSLVPAAAVIPARQVFVIIVVVKKFLALLRLVSYFYWNQEDWTFVICVILSKINN